MSFIDKIMGPSLATAEEAEQKVGPLAGIPMLGLDALSSAAYGPEATLSVLLALGALGLHYMLPITAVIVVLLAIVYFSYRQTIAAYPDGGGSYTVAKENLGRRVGLLAAASLMLDYILNVAVGIAAGVGALISVVPALHPYILPLCLVILGLITFVNLHGIKESGTVFIVPTYLFVGSLGLVILIGLAKTFVSGGAPVPVDVPPVIPAASIGAGFWLLLRAFANGCTAMTGVEAISNGVTAFKPTAVANAQRTLTFVIMILSVLLAGIAYLCHAYGIAAIDPDSASYQSILSQLTTAILGRGFCYYITMGSVIAIVCLSANTSFADFPRLCRLLAIDNFLPYSFTARSRRLVYAEGIIILAVMSCLLLIAFDGITDRLIPLFAVGAFGAFTLSQAGMVVHWWKLRGPGNQHGSLSMAVNAFGAVSTGLVLLVVLATKFVDGAWIIVLLVPLLLCFFLAIKRHYVYVAQQTECRQAFSIDDLQPPVMVVVMRQWSTITRNALHFARELSTDVVAIHISADAASAERLQHNWQSYVETPLRQRGQPPLRLLVVDSPYRRFFNPLLATIREIEASHPGRTIAVVIPELVGGRWYDYFLHNRLTTALKAVLLINRDQRIVVVNVPWYLQRRSAKA